MQKNSNNEKKKWKINNENSLYNYSDNILSEITIIYYNNKWIRNYGEDFNDRNIEIKLKYWVKNLLIIVKINDIY